MTSISSTSTADITMTSCQVVSTGAAAMYEPSDNIVGRDAAVAVAALSAMLTGTTDLQARPRLRVTDLVSSVEDAGVLLGVKAPVHPSSSSQVTLPRIPSTMMMTGIGANHNHATILPSPTPVPLALHRLSRDRAKLAPLQPMTMPTTTGGGVVPNTPPSTPLPHLAPSILGGKSTVVLVDDDHPMTSGGVKATPKPRPAKRTTDDYKHAHMLAERKRRREMKAVFDQLAALLPPTGTSASGKRSKWETLVDTIDYLDGLEIRKRTLITRIKAAAATASTNTAPSS